MRSWTLLGLEKFLYLRKDEKNYEKKVTCNNIGYTNDYGIGSCYG